ncbi:hypothetical protein FACS1894217_13680 [Clostridia bacterium]|nr:hypothetical protein FACS1894217_13680 [Clostridia bacterium]
MDINHDKILANRAGVYSAEYATCDNCNETVLFAFRDSKGNEFSIGLSTVLDCVAFAIMNGDLPKLPVEWCRTASKRYDGRIDNIEVWSTSDST